MTSQRTQIILLAVALLLSGAWISSGMQDASWVNESVLPVKQSKYIPFEDTVNGNRVAYHYSGQWPIKVRDDRDDPLRIHDGYHEGWVLKSDFVLAKDAPPYFERRIQTNPTDAWAWNMRGAG